MCSMMDLRRVSYSVGEWEEMVWDSGDPEI